MRRSLSEGVKEFEVLRRFNEELRVVVKKVESERVRWGDAGVLVLSFLSSFIFRFEFCFWNLILFLRFWGNRRVGEFLFSNYSLVFGLF